MARWWTPGGGTCSVWRTGSKRRGGPSCRPVATRGERRGELLRIRYTSPRQTAGIVVQTPFANVTVHTVQPPRVGRVTPHGRRPAEIRPHSRAAIRACSIEIRLRRVQACSVPDTKGCCGPRPAGVSHCASVGKRYSPPRRSPPAAACDCVSSRQGTPSASHQLTASTGRSRSPVK